MKFVCDRCHTRYSISDEKVRGKVLKIRCKTCGNIIVVREQGAESASAAAGGQVAARGPAPRTELEVPRAAAGGGGGSAAGPAPSRNDVEWFVAVKGKQHGPMSKDQLVDLLRQGKVHDRSYCWNEDLPGWTRMRELPDFQEAIAQGPAPGHAQKPPPPPPPEGAEVVDLQAHRQQRQQQTDPAAAAHADPFAAVSQGVPGAGPMGATPAGGFDPNAPRESTRVFIMNAGLHNRSAKHKTYAVIASVVFVTLVTLGYLDFRGIVQIPLLNSVVSSVASATGVEVPEERKKLAREKLLASFGDEEIDPELKCKLLKEDCPEPIRRKLRARKKGGGDDLAGAFETGGPGDSDLKRRGLDGPGGIDDPTQSDALRAAELKKMFGEKKLTAPKVKLPAGKAIEVASSNIDAESIAKVVGKNKGAIQSCIERSAKTGNIPGGKQKLVITIVPKGLVAKARFTNGVVNASPVGECIAKVAKKWKFPPFAGDAADVEIPLVLSAM